MIKRALQSYQPAYPLLICFRCGPASTGKHITHVTEEMYIELYTPVVAGIGERRLFVEYAAVERKGCPVDTQEPVFGVSCRRFMFMF